MAEGMPLFPIQHGITIAEIRSHSPSLAGINILNANAHSIESIASAIADRLGELQVKPQQQPPEQPLASPADSEKDLRSDLCCTCRNTGTP